MSQSDQELAVYWRDSATADATLHIVINTPHPAAESAPVDAPGVGGDPAERPGQDCAQASTPAARCEGGADEASGGSSSTNNSSTCLECRTIPLHSLILSAYSEYFKARLHRTGAAAEMQQQQCDSGGGSGNSGHGCPRCRRVVVTEHVESTEDADALEAAVRFCYSHLLCEVGGVTKEISVARLLKVVELSDRYIMRRCMAAALAELGRRRSGQYENLSAVSLFFNGLPPGAQSSRKAPVIQYKARRHLIRQLEGMEEGPISAEQTMLLHQLQLNNAEAVCTSYFAAAAAAAAAEAADTTDSDSDAGEDAPSAADDSDDAASSDSGNSDSDDSGGCGRLDLLLPHLPFQALLHLLQGTLIARSENSVLMMVAAWEDVASTYSSEVEEVVAALRLGQLSQVFLFESLESTSFLDLTSSQAHLISRFATAAPAHQAALLRCVIDRPDPDSPTFVAAWFAGPRTVWPEAARPLHFSRNYSEADIRRELAKLRRCMGRAKEDGGLAASRDSTILLGDFFCNGVFVRLELVLAADPALCRIISKFHVTPVRYPSEDEAFEQHLRIIDGQVQVSVNDSDAIPLARHSLTANEGSACLHKLTGDGLDISSWVPYLVGGRMQVRGTIEHCGYSG